MRKVEYKVIIGESTKELDNLLMYLGDKYANDNFKVYFRNDVDIVALVRYEVCNCKYNQYTCRV